MATRPMNKIVQQIRRAVLQKGDTDLTDAQLLKCFIADKEEAAFAALVRRHGPMVWGVCRRVLLQDQDAEDAFQATFMVLVKKAPSIQSHELLANWLYGVASLTARKARALKMKRNMREKQMDVLPEAPTQTDHRRFDLRPVIDGELSRLPEKYRIPIVLCDLEGKTRAQVAQQLGCPEGTVAGRLARAREMLARRLTRCGVAVSATVLTAWLVQGTASASAPATVITSTIKAGSLIAAGRTASEVLSVKVAALMQGVLKAMLLSNSKTLLMLAATVVLWGGTLLVTVLAGSGDHGPKSPPEKRAAESSLSPANTSEVSHAAPDSKKQPAANRPNGDGPAVPDEGDPGRPDGPGPHGPRPGDRGPGFGPPGRGPGDGDFPPDGKGPRPGGKGKGPGPGDGPGPGFGPKGPGPGGKGPGFGRPDGKFGPPPDGKFGPPPGGGPQDGKFGPAPGGPPDNRGPGPGGNHACLPAESPIDGDLASVPGFRRYNELHE